MHVSGTQDGGQADAPFRSRRTTVLAWSICAVALIGIAGGVAIEVGRGRIAPGAETVLEQVLMIVGFAALPVIGALVASRHPHNAVGWLFLAMGAGIGVLVLALEYARWAIDQLPQDLPGLRLAVLVPGWLWVPSVAPIGTLVLLLFPDGRPPSPRWRWLGWASVATIALMTAGGMVQDRVKVAGQTFDNPLGIGVFDDAEAFLALLLPVLGVLSILCAASLVVRFRRSRGDERQQLKWLAFSGGLLVVGLSELPYVFPIGLLAMEASLAVAMLKYRLYEIDRIINKTLVYGILTALLVAGYAGGVIFMQAALPLPDNSPVAVAGSTLTMAALFGPLRAWIQRIVDRRFYRSKYDASKTIEAFEVNLRKGTDLDGLTGELAAVVRQTVHPSHVSVVLIDAGGKST